VVRIIAGRRGWPGEPGRPKPLAPPIASAGAPESSASRTSPAVLSGAPSQARAGDRSPRSWSKRAGIGVPGSNAGLRSVSIIGHIAELELWAPRINAMRILVSCPRAYRTLAWGAGVRETCHPTAGHTASEALSHFRWWPVVLMCHDQS
jgi:hypothetical protein